MMRPLLSVVRHARWHVVLVPVDVSSAFVRVCVVAAVYRTRWGAWAIVDNGESTRLAVGFRAVHHRRRHCCLTTGLICGVYHAFWMSSRPGGIRHVGVFTIHWVSFVRRCGTVSCRA